MTIIIKKAGEAVAKKVIQAGGSKTAVAASQAHTPVNPPRAVNKFEAHLMMPAKEASKETMMPWRGWIKRFVKDKLSDSQYEAMRKTFYFMPDDPNNLMQSPFPITKTPISNDGEQAAYREVSPGSQGPVRVPLFELDDDPYDSGYFKKDTRRRYVDPEFPNPDIEKMKLDMMDPNDPEVLEAKEKLAAGPRSSPGNKLNYPTGPSDFDSTGLRAVMSTTHAEMQKELDKHMPNHVSTRTPKKLVIILCFCVIPCVKLIRS
jgi:hypothetical protein